MSEPVVPHTLGPDGFEGMDVFSAPEPIDHSVRFARILRPNLTSVPEELAAASHDRASRGLRAYHRVGWLMGISDVLAVVLAFLLASLAHDRVAGATPVDVRMLLTVTPLLVVGVFLAFRLYAIPRMPAAEEFRRLLLAVTMIITSAVTLSYWTKASFSRMWIGLSWVMALFLVLTTRYLWRRALREAREHGRLSLRTLIVGANDEAGRVAIEMRQPDLGFVPVGYVCADAWGRPTTDIPMLGHIDDLEELIVNNEADCIFVASSAIRPEHMAQVSKAARRQGVEVRVTANVQEILSSRVAAQPLGGLMAFALKPVRLSGLQALAKRTFDLVVTSVASLLLLPVFAMIAVAVKCTSAGPVFFTQERVGYHGRPFKILKFRTMVADAEDQLDGLLDLNEASGPLFKMKADPRVTRVGRLLRKWSLDELPQLVNVLRGHMSLVGPRPPLSREVVQYADWQMARLEVRPGLTGLWQVSGRSELSFDDYVRLDLFYIENWSLSYDLFILVKTIPTLVTRRGAH